MMHMTFYWGINATILFDAWKTTTLLYYSLSLLLLFLISALHQYLSSLRASWASSPAPKSDAQVPLLAKIPSPRGSNLFESLIFGVNVGISYMLMLAVMSFNAGVFLAVVLGLTAGYHCFRSFSVVPMASDADPCGCS